MNRHSKQKKNWKKKIKSHKELYRIAFILKKLEELLRTGTPAALAEANDLMKVMSGFVCILSNSQDLKRQPDYQREFSDELEKLKNKAVQLNDVISRKKPGDRWERDSHMEVFFDFILRNYMPMSRRLKLNYKHY